MDDNTAGSTTEELSPTEGRDSALGPGASLTLLRLDAHTEAES